MRESRNYTYVSYSKWPDIYNALRAQIINQAAGTLDHCIANDLFEEFGPNGDVRDAMATLYTGEQIIHRSVTSLKSNAWSSIVRYCTYYQFSPYDFSTYRLILRCRQPRQWSHSSTPCSYSPKYLSESLTKSNLWPMGSAYLKPQRGLYYPIPKQLGRKQYDGAPLCQLVCHMWTVKTRSSMAISSRRERWFIKTMGRPALVCLWNFWLTHLI
jgi:hypothetical protein